MTTEESEESFWDRARDVFETLAKSEEAREVIILDSVAIFENEQPQKP